MSFEELYPTPDFRKYLCNAGIDFVTVTSDARLDSTQLRAMGAKVSRNRRRATRHNANRQLLDQFASACPDKARIEALEVFLDFEVRSGHIADEHPLLWRMQRFLWSRLYPWDAPGIQAGARSSRQRGKSTTLIPGWVARNDGGVMRSMGASIRMSHTVYFGHKLVKHADPTRDNFGYVRAYLKKTDDGADLPDHHRVRVEVHLNREGCRNFELIKLADLRAFRYRRLAAYFRMVEPLATFSFPAKVLRQHPILRQAAASVRAYEQRRMEEDGAYVGILSPDVRLGAAQGHTEANRKIADILENLTKMMSRIATAVP